MATTKRDFNSRTKKPDLTTLVYGKVPPQAPDFEASVLGCCLDINGRNIFEQVLGIITNPEVFYVDAHQKIFNALLRLYGSGSPIDLLIVTNELNKSQELEMVGGHYFLTTLAMKAVTDANIDYHCRILVERFVGRELIRISGSVIGDAYDNSTDVFLLADSASDEYYKLLSGSVQTDPKSISYGMREVAEKMEVQKLSNSNLTGIPSGFSELDRITKGWQKTDLTILAARPSVGKTAFMLALCWYAAKAGYPVLIFSLEMRSSQLAQRMAAAISGVEMSQLGSPKDMTPDEWDRFNAAKDEIAKLPIYVDDTAGITSTELRAKARKMRTKHSIGLIAIDYLQLMSGVGKEGNREQEISKISRDLKNLGKDLDVPVLALSQLNRSIEGANGEASRDPRLSDLRESGAIEQDADNVIFISNPSAIAITKTPFLLGKKMIKIAKGRNIGLGEIALEFNPSTQKWKDATNNQPHFGQPNQPENPAAGIRRDTSEFGGSKLFIPGGGFQSGANKINVNWEEDGINPIKTEKRTDEDAPW